MPVIIPAGYGEVTFVWEGSLVPDGKAALVFGTALAGTGSLSGTLAGWVNSWSANLAPSQHVSLRMTEASLVTATSGTASGPSIQGGFGGDPAPPNVALHVRKRTTNRGRRAVGHMYPPGLVPDTFVQVDGKIGASQRDAMQALFDAFLAGGPAPMVILARSEGRTPPPNVPYTVNALEVDGVVSTQRKRLR